MKKVVLICTAALLVVSLSACSAIRNRIVSAVRNAIEDSAISPDKTEQAVQLDDPAETDALDQTELPQETEIAVETAEPDPTQAEMGASEFSPEEIPAFVPKFQYGTYIAKDSGKLIYDGSAIYTMSFSGVQKKDLQEYAESLKKAGYSDVAITEYDGGVIVTGTTQQDGTESSAMITLNTADGTCVFLLTVVTKK